MTVPNLAEHRTHNSLALLRLELRVTARSERQDELTGLGGVDFHGGVQVLESILEVRSGDQRAATVHADAVEEARDDIPFGPVHTEN